jgi:hypothetical protein
MKKFKLPIKWAVKRTLDNSVILNEWNNNHPLFNKQKRTEAHYICDEDYFYNDQAHSGELLNEYTEITYEQFLEYVLTQTIQKPKYNRLLFILKYIENYGN